MLTSGLDRQLHEQHMCTHIHIDKVEEGSREENQRAQTLGRQYRCTLPRTTWHSGVLVPA